MPSSAHIRFTRSGQSTHFVVLGLIFFCLSLGLFVLSVWPQHKEFIRPVLKSSLWSLIPLPLVGACWWKAFRLSRDPYLVWTPIGLEIYPFFQPQARSQLIPWAEIGHLQITEPPAQLRVDFSTSENSGVIVTLAPLSRARRALLRHLVEGMAKQLAAARSAN